LYKINNLKIMTKLFLTLMMVFLLSSCALHYTYTYQPTKENTGKVVVIPVRPTPSSFVMLNDSLVINNKNIKTRTLENLPEGKYKIQFYSNSEIFKDKIGDTFEIEVKNGSNLTHIVNIPPISNGYWVYAGLITSTLYAVLYMPLILANQ